MHNVVPNLTDSIEKVNTALPINHVLQLLPILVCANQGYIVTESEVIDAIGLLLIVLIQLAVSSFFGGIDSMNEPSNQVLTPSN